MRKIKYLNSKSPLEIALETAHNFKGTKNSDWTPIIMPLGEIDPTTPLPDMEMCLVPVGKFMMGGESGYEHSKPIHEQIITKPYWIGRYPITNAQWLAAVISGAVKEPCDTTGYKDKNMADCPVVYVDWFESRQLALWAKCNLPSENLWEYAARGVDNLTYPWGNDFVADNVVYGENSGGKPNLINTKPKGASWVGAGHLSGNVWEWCSSAYKSYPYVARDGRENISPDNFRVLRGGSWFDTNNHARAVYRSLYRPTNRSYYFGFRLFCCFSSLSSWVM